MIRITKRSVEAAEPRETRYILFDRDIRGFGLRVSPSGAKAYVFEYRPGEGGRRVAKKRITIGKVGDLTPEQARKEAERLRARTKLGDDPQSEKVLQRQSMTVAEVARRFLDEHVSAKRKPSTKVHYEDVLNRILLPKLGSRKAKDVTRADLAKLHLEWSHTPFQANRVLAISSSMYSFAAKHGLVPEGLNPARGIEKFAEGARERYLSTAELQQIGAALREAETTGIPWEIVSSKNVKHVPKKRQTTVLDPHAAAALRLLIFTGARLREILHLEWSHVDLQRGLLLLPDSKTGRKTIVLNAPAMEILATLPRLGRYVIAGRSAGSEQEKPRSDLKRPWAAVASRAGLEKVRLHDLRHNFASFGVGGGMGLPIIGKLLGHTQSATTQRYAHLDADPLRKAADAIGMTIAAAMGEAGSQAIITPFRSRADR